MARELDELIIAPDTRVQLQHVVAYPHQGILLHGDVGVGLKTIASALAHDMGAPPAAIHVVEKGDELGIGIDKIRSLYRLFKTKHEATVIIVDDADAMKTDAQNALLKLLEEPPQNTYFILTSHTPEHLLPTVMSRIQPYAVPRIDPSLTAALVLSADATRAAQISFLSAGYPAEISRLLQDDGYFSSRRDAMLQARSYMTGNPYERLVIISKLNDRQKAVDFLAMMARILMFSLDKAPTTKLTDNIAAVESAQSLLRSNGNVRLVLTDLSLSIKQI